MSEVRTLCHICGDVASHVCKLCGRHVCKDHYDSATGLCSSCRAGRKLGGKAGKVMS